MRDAFLRADERNDLLERIEILAKPALHEARDGFAELDQAQCQIRTGSWSEYAPLR